MELRTLRSFLAVAREGNVTRAARSLHITQPALSRQLLELERELGCELLVRESRGVTLTDAGMLLRKRAEEIVMLADRAELEIRSPEADVEGDVWIGSGESRAIESVAKVAAQLSERHPDIHLRLHSGNRDDVVERVDKGLLDFGVGFGEEPPTRYDSMKLPGEDTWGMLVRADDPLALRDSITLDELRGERIIASGQSSNVASQDDPTITFFGETDFNVVATYTLLYNASLLVEQGLGIAVCFDGIVATGEGTPFAFVPFEGMERVSSYLVWKRYQPLSRACEAFLRAMREACGAVE
ncbi:MAG: LysR family transcriptional regulator [Atopobiaceae bacterium]|nr:LysR family transcriptional regulator [Atopobiaceae bacterium]